MSIALSRNVALLALVSTVACDDGRGSSARSDEPDAAVDLAGADDAATTDSGDAGTTVALEAGAASDAQSAAPADASAPGLDAGATPMEAGASDGSAQRPIADAANDGHDAFDAASVSAEDATVAAANDAANDGASAPVAAVCTGDRWAMDPTSAAAVAHCTSITGNLVVAGALAEIALPSLASVEGYLTIWSMPALTRIHLPALARVGGFLDVSANNLLRSVTLPALRNVNERRVSAARDVAIRDNPVLPACQAEQVRAQLLSLGFSGSIDVSGNGPVCAP